MRLWIRVLLLYLWAVAAPSGWIFNKIHFPAKIEKIELPTWPLPALRFRPVEMTYIYKIKFSLSEIFKENNSPAGGGTTLVLYIIFIRKLLAEDKMWSFLHSHTIISLGKTLPFDKSVNRYENISATNILHKSITFSDKHKIFLYIDWLNRSDFRLTN